MSFSHTLAPVCVGGVGLKPTKKVPLKIKLLDRLYYVVGRLYNFTERGQTTHRWPLRYGPESGSKISTVASTVQLPIENRFWDSSCFDSRSTWKVNSFQPPTTSPTTQELYARVEEVSKFMAILSLPRPGDLFLSPAELHKIVLHLPKRKESSVPKQPPSDYPALTCGEDLRACSAEETKPLLSPRQKQYGFRTGHSTTLQLTRALHYLPSEMNCG
ncbi:hypothetical protein EVAR_84499_1 [Eumeta japonica]|uniref:Uncharacterized protein n=1 Tax=Eumeta variegata TaxID=151549 RepID=A0A4C1UHK9_EUMVA|nr:hypothetical protein EVAR_84499_1 [Eumeta japonica]